jgi:tRNA (guanosine-2'-O-)-methyltransferase
LADEFIKIPMYGFTESFNISVSAGILLYHFSRKLRSSEIDWRIPENELLEIKIDWLKKSIKRPDLIEKYFLDKNSGELK